MRRKNLSLNLSVKLRDEVQNVFVNSFQSRSGLSALCKIEKTNSTEWKTGVKRPQTARPERNASM